MKNPNYINGSGYYSPTEGKAMGHIICDERKKAKAERRKQDANRKRKLQNSDTNQSKRGRRTPQD